MLIIIINNKWKTQNFTFVLKNNNIEFNKKHDMLLCIYEKKNINQFGGGGGA